MNTDLHVVNLQMYLKIFYVLLALTVLTFLQPYILSPNLSQTVVIQMFLAIAKTVIIVAYYMHLKYESQLFKIIVYMAVVVLFIFFIITASDAIFRNESFDLFR